MPKSVLQEVLGRMQFALHGTRRAPHGASRLVQAMSAWLVKTRRASSWHSRDARVYGHTTTAMHKLSTPRPLQTLRIKTGRSWIVQKSYSRGINVEPQVKRQISRTAAVPVSKVTAKTSSCTHLKGDRRWSCRFDTPNNSTRDRTWC